VTTPHIHTYFFFFWSGHIHTYYFTFSKWPSLFLLCIFC